MRYERARNAALLLGIGLGGLFDGIVLHPMQGWIDMATWLASALGVFLLWGTVRGAGRLPSTRTFGGYLLVGWGAFNFLEGALNHHVLELHHVRDLPVHDPFYDWLFLLGGGVGFILLGLALRDGLGRPAPLSERRSGLERRAY